MAFGSGVRHMIRETLIWGGVLGAGFAGVYYFDEMRAFFARTAETAVATFEKTTTREQDNASGFERSVTLKAGENGHFYARAHINGRSVSVLVDTGATGVALTHEDARELGIAPRESEYTLQTQTANGSARVAPVRLDSVRIDSIEVRDLRGLVAEPGALPVTLLGMEFIGRLSRFELRGQELLLVE